MGNFFHEVKTRQRTRAWVEAGVVEAGVQMQRANQKWMDFIEAVRVQLLSFVLALWSLF